MNAGRKHEWVAFQQRAVDGNGDRLGDWDVLGQVETWARVTPRTGTEAVLQARLQGVQPVEIEVDLDENTEQLTNAWRMVWGGRFYNLSPPTPDDRGSSLKILGQSDGSDV